MATKKFTRKEVAETDSKEIRFIIHNQVYHVTEFQDNHPGGHEVLVQVSGKDASEDFEDIGHSLDAKELMKKYVIGEVVDEEKIDNKKKNMKWTGEKNEEEEPSFLSSWKFPVAMGILLTVVYTYLFG